MGNVILKMQRIINQSYRATGKPPEKIVLTQDEWEEYITTSLTLQDPAVLPARKDVDCGEVEWVGGMSFKGVQIEWER